MSNNRQQQVSYSEAVYNYGLKDFFAILFANKLIILLTTLAFSVAGVVYSLSLKNEYQSDMLLESARNNESSLGAAAAQVGQLASLAGFSLPGGGTDTLATDLAILESRQFLALFIEKYQLKIPLFAAYDYDMGGDKLILDSEVYDASTKTWTRKVKFPIKPEPSLYEAVELLRERLDISTDKVTGLITVSVKFYSPLLTKKWLDNLIKEFNGYVKDKEISIINANIDYLDTQARQIENREMQSVFYNLMEEQQKKAMLASSSQEYVFKVIDPAIVPEKKASPKRAIICVMFFLGGFFLSILYVLATAYFKDES